MNKQFRHSLIFVHFLKSVQFSILFYIYIFFCKNICTHIESLTNVLTNFLLDSRLLRDPSLANHPPAAGRSQLPAYFFKRPNRGELILRLLRSSRAYTPLLPNRFPTNAAQWPEKRYIARDPNRVSPFNARVSHLVPRIFPRRWRLTAKVRKQGPVPSFHPHVSLLLFAGSR